MVNLTYRQLQSELKSYRADGIPAQINNGFKPEDIPYVYKVEHNLDNYTVKALLSRGFSYDDLPYLNANLILART